MSERNKLYTMIKKKHQVHGIFNKYFIAWPRIMNAGQIDILFIVHAPVLSERDVNLTNVHYSRNICCILYVHSISFSSKHIIGRSTYDIRTTLKAMSHLTAHCHKLALDHKAQQINAADNDNDP